MSLIPRGLETCSNGTMDVAMQTEEFQGVRRGHSTGIRAEGDTRRTHKTGRSESLEDLRKVRFKNRINFATIRLVYF